MRDQVTGLCQGADGYKDRWIAVQYDGGQVARRKKKVLAPGEMEQVVLKKDSFAQYPDLKRIVICTEED